jgi:hypothetical protein
MKKLHEWRARRDKWFRSMFAKCFAEYHEVRGPKKPGPYDIVWFPPLYPPKKAKHPDYGALETRLKAVEQKVCDHTFCDRQKGCMESIFCSKCGALDPAWQKAPAKRYDEDGEVRDGYIEPEVYADGTGYIRKPKED